MAVVAVEKQKYEDVWASLDRYGDHAPGEALVDIFQDMVAAQGLRASGLVLDAGCGSGKGGVALRARGYDVYLCDLTNTGLVFEASQLPFTAASITSHRELRALLYLASLGKHVTEFDFAYCCDVMEHLPTEYTLLAAANLLSVAKRVFFSIATVPDQFGVWVGEPLHLTVQPYTWWRDRLNDVGRVLECRDLVTCGVYLVEGK